MNPLKSIKGRIDGLRDDIKSGYWEYVRYYNDGVIWDDAVLIESFGGSNFQGNPWALFKEIFTDPYFEGYRIFIVDREPEKLIDHLKGSGFYDGRIRVIARNTPEYRDVLSHAKYLINNVSFPMDWIKKPGQIYLNTWHGTPLKCLGRSVRNDPFEFNNAQRNMLLSDILLAPNELTARVFEDDHMLRGIMPGDVVRGGYPRNVPFFDRDGRDAVREKFGLAGKTALFYMPTWRGNASEVKDYDFAADMERLAADLGDGYVIYVKLHPAMKQSVGDLCRCRVMPEGYEVYEFLNAMDILVTDYSSVYFDFANAGNRIILYQFDSVSYFSERGVYPEVLQDTPYPVVTTYDGLLHEIKDPSVVNDEDFRRAYCPYDGPDAAKNLLALLKEYEPKEASGPVDLYLVTRTVTDAELLKIKESMAGRNFRFVFVPRRSNKRFSNITVFDKIDYLTCFDSGRTVPGDIFRRRSAAKRERTRLWGGMKIGRVYSDGGRAPYPFRHGMEIIKK